MSTLVIRKKSLKTWLHTDSILGDFIISKFYFNADNVSFQIVEQGQSKRVIYNINDITLYAVPTGGTAETFTTITELSLRLEELNYTAFQYDGQITSIANLIDAGTNITITGEGTEASPYVISSGGSQNLGSVLAEGNTTDGTDISISDGDAVILDNGSKLIKGTTDAGNGGNNGIALRCSIDYELKWEAGRLYVMEQDGFTIREVKYNFTDTPTVDDDNTKGFVIGSRWILDNDDVYSCTDDTTGAAVWELIESGVPTLQQVTTAGNETTDDVIFRLDADKYLKINTASQTIEFWDESISLVSPIGTYLSTGISFDDFTGNYSSFSPTSWRFDLTDGSIIQYNLGTLSFDDGTGSTILNLAKEGITIGNGADSLYIEPTKITSNGVEYPLPTGETSPLATLPIIVTANKTAELNQIYNANGTITFTDPTSVTNKGYIVHVISGTSTIGGVGYTAGALVYRYYDGANWVTKDYGATPTPDLFKTTASGTDTYTATVSGVAAYDDGAAYLVRFTNGNTTGATLNINSIGAKTLYRNNDGELIGGDIQNGAEMLCVYNSTLNGFQCIGTSPNSLFAYVTNADSVTLTKGMPVYAFGGQGDRMTVKRALNTSDATSAQTVGLVLSNSIGTNQKGLIIIQGLLDGLSILPTSTFADGDAIYLGATAGSITNVKPYAPNHLVYLGVVTTASNGSAGRMYVRVQNGYEMQELHNVQAQSPSLKDTLYYDTADSQWKTASITTILGYTPEDVANKSTSTSLGTSNTLYPTQNAVKTYVDTALAEQSSVGADLYLFNNY